MATRAEAFDDLVLETAERFRSVLGRRWHDVEFAVEDIPPQEPAEWEGGVPLARLWPARGRLPARVVVYRRPVEGIAGGSDRALVVHEVLVEQIALLLGVPPHEVDPGL